jgi:phage-related protein (TIGR01555 family)
MDAVARELRSEVVREDGLTADLAVGELPGLDEAARSVHELYQRVDSWRSGRADGWRNALTLLGDAARDKRMASSFASERLTDFMAGDLWRGDGMAARAVETVPDMLVRAGWSMVVKADPAEEESSGAPDQQKPSPDRQDKASDVFMGGGEAQAAKELSEGIDELAKTLGLAQAFGEAMKKERGLGGAAIFPGIQDGASDLTRPLDYKRIRSVDWLDVLTPIELVPFQWYDNPVKAQFGEPELYWMQRYTTGGASLAPRVPIHESRLIVFPGLAVDKRHRREHWGWGDSILGRMLGSLRDFASGHDSAAALLQDFAQAAFGIDGLAEAMKQNQDDLLLRRIRLVEMARSVLRAVVHDSKETFERKQTPVTGMPDLLDRLTNRLAGDARMPVTILMGRAPAGLNATGDADVRNFYDETAGNRVPYLTPRLVRAYRMLFAAQRGPARGREPKVWNIRYGPLWQHTRLEESTIRKNNAEADAAMVDKGVVTPEEVAASRYGGDEYGEELQLNREIRAAFDKEAEDEAKVQAAQLQAQAEAKAAQAAAGGEGGDGEAGKPPSTGKKPAAGEEAQAKPPPDGGDGEEKGRGDAATTSEQALASVRDVEGAPGDVRCIDLGFQDGTPRARAIYAQIAKARPGGSFQDVKPRELHATQATVERAKVAKMLGQSYTPGEDERQPYVVRVQGKPYLVDGHHRAAAALLRGETLGAEVADLQVA